MLVENAVSLPCVIWRDVKDLRCYPDFSTFVMVDDAGIIYILKQIT